MCAVHGLRIFKAPSKKQLFYFTSLLLMTFVSSSTSNNSDSITVENILPGDESTWESLHRENKIYIDKTDSLQYILDLKRKLITFTRPRRFGKSFFLGMMSDFFNGKESLFRDSQIYKRGGNIVHNKPNGTWIQYPVIYLDFNKFQLENLLDARDTKAKIQSFKTFLQYRLKRIARHYAIDSSEPDFCISTLIEDLHNKLNLPVIVLIDEYDRAINRALYVENNVELAKGVSDVLEDFFSQIKGCITDYDQLRLVFVTGVTKFALQTLYTGPNNFKDLSYEKELVTAMGFTKDEIESRFKPAIELFCKKQNLIQNDFMGHLTIAYDGYKFSLDTDVKVFNPLSVINCLSDQRFDSYWSSTGSLQYIVERWYEGYHTIENFRNYSITRTSLYQKWDVVTQMVPLVYHLLFTGYLRIDKYNDQTDMCNLTYANAETEDTLRTGLLYYSPLLKKNLHALHLSNNLVELMQEPPDIPKLIEFLNRVGFRKYIIALGGNVSEVEISRRLVAILDTAQIVSTETKEFYTTNLIEKKKQTQRNIAIRTSQLKTNYIFKVNCGIKHGEAVRMSAWQGIQELIGYATDSNTRTNFINTIGNKNVYLMSLHFDPTHEGSIDEWVFLPFEDQRLRIDKMIVSNDGLLNQYKSTNITKSMDSKYFCLGDVVVGQTTSNP